jgi:hypothetical protein
MSKQHNSWTYNSTPSEGSNKKKNSKKLNDECQGKVDDVQHQTESRHGQLSQHMNVKTRSTTCRIKPNPDMDNYHRT